MALTDTEMGVLLAPAGLRLVERVRHAVRLPPLPEGGRFGSEPDEVADVDDPDFADKVNAGWHRMFRSSRWCPWTAG
ncbi:hypothetical protein [Streptacidiphilus jiangxiensis]|uniref:hypothetical protein n=1 Tax=Streptacidiphilus jiangxiensis TaxID=235985 RepID=UPI00116061C2|nr:hypothetical protein [Streptacidiphilus jiangxiensis]